MPNLKSGDQTNSILKMPKENERDMGDIPTSPRMIRTVKLVMYSLNN